MAFCHESMLIGNPAWSKPPVYVDDPLDPEEFNPLDDDYVHEEYRCEE